MGVLSKMKCWPVMKTIDCTCVEYVHPWTQSCADGSCSLFFDAVQDSGRIYFTVYLLALLMRGRIPTSSDLKRTLAGMIQSTAFLTANAFGYSLSLCTLRSILGHFNYWTISFLPGFIASLVAIFVERPSRRGLLCLYVTNVASETLFRMAVYRGLVRPIPKGEVMIFMASISVLLYFFRGQQYKHDTIYSLIRFLVGPYEEFGGAESDTKMDSEDSAVIRHPNFIKQTISVFLSKYLRAWYGLKELPRHNLCPHPSSCVHYVLQGGTKLFAVGYGLQLSLRLLLKTEEIIRRPQKIPRLCLSKKALHLGMFLGGFSALFRSTCCILRWLRNKDSPKHAIPAGLVAGAASAYYPDNTVTLYVMWKALQMLYSQAVTRGQLPRVPGGASLLYALSTGLIFHAAIWEPQNIRPSYWKFLLSLSGGRIMKMNREVLDCYGLQTSKNLYDLLAKTNTDINKYKIV